jgi:hypothetical protein
MIHTILDRKNRIKNYDKRYYEKGRGGGGTPEGREADAYEPGR